MQRTLFKALSQALVVNALGHFVNLAARLSLPPLFIYAWGVNSYADWLVLSSFAGMLAVADFGAQIYVVNRLTQSHTENDANSFVQIFYTGIVAFFLIPALAATALTVSVFWVDLREFLKLSTTLSAEARAVLVYFSWQFAFAFPLGIVCGAYRAIGKLTRGLALPALLTVVQFALVAVALRSQQSMVVVAALHVASYVGLLIISFVDLYRQAPELARQPVRIDLALAKTFLRPGSYFLGITLSNLISTQGFVIVAGMLVSASQTVLFVTVRTMVNALKQVVALVQNTAWTELTRLDSQGNRTALFVLFRAVLRLTLMLTVTVGAFLWTYGDVIYAYWLGNTVSYDQRLAAALLLYTLQSVFWMTSANLLMAINKHYRVAEVMFAAAVLSVLLGILGAKTMGLHGLAMALLVADVLLPLWVVPRLLYDYDNRFNLRFFVTETVPAAAIVVCVAAIPLSTALAPVFALWWCALALRSQKRSVSA